MSTGTVTPAHNTDAIISESVAALIGRKRPQDIAAGIGMSKTSIYNKLNGDSSWKAWEVDLIARHFGVPVGDLYDGFGGRFTPGAPVSSG